MPILLILAVSAGSARLCAGWASTSEERMACCVDEGTCPMHQADSHGPGATDAVSQAEADSCCAASEQDASTSSSAFVLAVSFALASDPAGLTLPSMALSGAWRPVIPLPPGAVPKHLLLSVLLV